MSFQAYVEGLVGSGLAAASIIGHDGRTWACSPGFKLEEGEGAVIANLFNNPSDASNGIVVNGRDYTVSKADERLIYGHNGDGGVVLVKTGLSIIIGVYDDRIQLGKAVSIVEKLADYFTDLGY